MKSVFCVAVSLLMVVAPSGFAVAGPGAPAGTPAALLPHAEPRPIPNIDSYHVIVDTEPYEVRDKDGRLLGMEFSTPAGALCGLNIGVVFEPTKYSMSSCFSDEFPQVPAPGTRSVVGGTGKKRIENIYTDNAEDNYGYFIVSESIVAGGNVNPPNSDGLGWEFQDSTRDHWNHDLHILGSDFLGGFAPGDFPVLPPGNILSFTPDDTYYSQNKTATFKVKLPSLPVACAVGYNSVVWCGSYTLVTTHTDQTSATVTPIPKDKAQPKGFYVTPKKAVYYNGYNDPGTVLATK